MRLCALFLGIRHVTRDLINEILNSIRFDNCIYDHSTQTMYKNKPVLIFDIDFFRNG